MTDINALFTVDAHDAGSEMNVMDQFGKTTDMFITVVGVDSKIWRQIDADRNQKLIARMLKPDEVVEIDERSTTLAKASIAWRGFTFEGEPYEFSTDRAAELYHKAPYIADQVDRFIGKRANFIKG